jgi:DNA adenine methylase
MPRRRAKCRVQRRLLKAIHRRLAGVVIECLPYDEAIARYDRPGALFYLDPPYWACEDDYGPGLFHRGDFARLAGILAGLKGRFILSLNDTNGVRETFKAFEIESVETVYSIGTADRGAAAAEVIISDGRRPGDGCAEQLGLL